MNCLYCSKQLTGNQQKFCSVHCSNKYRSVKPDGSRPADPRPQLKHCEMCGKKLTGRQRQFCSIACKGKKLDYVNQKKRGRSRKLNIIEILGGGCQRCGYKGNLATLSFHHLDPTQKEFQLAWINLANRPMDKVLEELEKCELLCANCHMEEHHPTLGKQVLEATIANLQQLNTFEQKSGCCVICEALLDGRQKQFCSPQCRNAYHQNYANQQFRGIERKRKLVEMIGGNCAHCGYDDNLAGLNFHHEGGKDYKLDLRNLANRSWKVILTEAKKCALLCGNCHAEVHHPELSLAEITKTHPV